MEAITEVDLFDEETGQTHRGKVYLVIPGWAWDADEKHWVELAEPIRQAA